MNHCVDVYYTKNVKLLLGFCVSIFMQKNGIVIRSMRRAAVVLYVGSNNQQ
jgi:hypothetical protein